MIWCTYVNICLGAWLVATAFASSAHEPAMFWSDVVTGALIVLLGSAALVPRFDAARWGLLAAGLWLLFAPLIYWTASAAAYTNDTLVGSLVITFSVLVPVIPGRAHREVLARPGPDVPPGWSYSPSDWVQRIPIVATALFGFLLSRYLAAYQLGHIDTVWDPFFGDGTRRVLESEVSKAFPVADAGLGAVAYLIEALSGCLGGRSRWRTMPWMVLLFVVQVVPLSVVSLVLVVLQPVSVGAWCTLCLVAAGAMLIMISPALDELVATLQFLGAARREGKPLWRTFWVGGTLEEPGPRPAAAETRPFSRQILDALDLNNVPLNLVPAAAIGIWIIAAPAVLGMTAAAATSAYVAGALAVTWSVIAFSEIARPARLLNVPTGLWMIAGALLFDGHTAASVWNGVAAGAVLIVLSIRRGRIEASFGAWNRYLY